METAATRLMLVDKQVSPNGHLANAALSNVCVIKYDSDDTTLAELQQMIRTAHYKNGAPFASIACAQHGCDAEGLWTWTSDLVVDLGGGSPLSPAMQLSPIIEVLGAALEKTKLGKAHIDLLACGLAAFAPRLVVGLEKLYGVDFRASTDDTGNDVNGGDWKMETDGDYDVANDYLDRAKLMAYTEKMCIPRLVSMGKLLARAFNLGAKNVFKDLGVHASQDAVLGGESFAYKIAEDFAQKKFTALVLKDNVQKFSKSRADLIKASRNSTNKNFHILEVHPDWVVNGQFSLTAMSMSGVSSSAAVLKFVGNGELTPKVPLDIQKFYREGQKIIAAACAPGKKFKSKSDEAVALSKAEAIQRALEAIVTAKGFAGETQDIQAMLNTIRCGPTEMFSNPSWEEPALPVKFTGLANAVLAQNPTYDPFGCLKK